jgi:hypothetical protein
VQNWHSQKSLGVTSPDTLALHGSSTMAQPCCSRITGNYLINSQFVNELKIKLQNLKCYNPLYVGILLHLLGIQSHSLSHSIEALNLIKKNNNFILQSPFFFLFYYIIMASPPGNYFEWT